MAAGPLAFVLVGCSGSPPHAGVNQQPPPTVSALRAAPLTLDPDYQGAVMHDVATSLNRSTTQIRAQLAVQPGSTLMNVAKPLGVAEDALARNLRSALSSATATRVRSGAWTPSQATQLTSFWTAQPDPDLITRISQWFRDR